MFRVGARGSVPERESEFTGLKGFVLRYVGSAWALLIASRLVEALAEGRPGAAGVLGALSTALGCLAFLAYPVYELASEISSNDPAR